MNIEKIILFLIAVITMMTGYSFYRLDEFRLDVTGILVGTVVVLMLLLWIINKRK